MFNLSLFMTVKSKLCLLMYITFYESITLMTIKIGDHIPDVSLKQITKTEILDISSRSLFRDKRVALFSVVGAFTPVCSLTHLSGFNNTMEEFRNRNMYVMCIAVNDHFVLKAWAESYNAHSEIIFLSDWNADFAKAAELFEHIDGLGIRSSRYSMVVEDGIIKILNVEPIAKDCNVSSGEHLLSMV
jgi:peroxiredoxin